MYRNHRGQHRRGEGRWGWCGWGHTVLRDAIYRALLVTIVFHNRTTHRTPPSSEGLGVPGWAPQWLATVATDNKHSSC